MTMDWVKYRGPGDVKFSPARTTLDGGKAVTIASFSEPGAYIFQVVVDDGSGK